MSFIDDGSLISMLPGTNYRVSVQGAFGFYILFQYVISGILLLDSVTQMPLSEALR
jgi:hypothetical protein